MTDHDLVMSGNGLSSPRSNGDFGHADNFSAENGAGGVNLGWQKVTNPKKHKRQELKSKGQTPGSLSDNVKRGSDNKVFQALEKEAEERRAHREALMQAAVDAASRSTNVQSDSDVEGDDYQADAHTASNGDSKKSKPKKPKKQKVSVAQAASAIDPSSLQSFLNEISESFSELPDVQLMRFADYFGRVFSAVSPTQFGWNKILKESSVAKAVEVPLCYIPESVNTIASNWLAARPLDALGDFLVWALIDVLNDIQPQQGTHKGSKGISPNNLSGKTKVAVLVVLALAIRKRPEALYLRAGTLGSSPQFQGLEKLPMLAWAYGQAAHGDLVVGMQLWVKNLLPLSCAKISTPSSRDIALQFAESVLFANLKKTQPVLQNASSRRGERLVPPVALVSLMRAAFPSDVARTKATERFLGIYPIVKELSLAGAHRSKATKSAAQHLLPLSLEAASEDIPGLAHEACDMFIWCLSENLECFKQWEKLYLENLKGSIQVLGYACNEWSNVADRLSPLNDLRNTVNVLRAKNHTALESTKGNLKLETLVKLADKNCKVLNKKLARVGICFKVTAMVITGVCAAYGLYLLNPGAL